MNASYSSMRSVASTLVATAVLLLVSCSLGTQGPAGGFVLAAVPKGPQTQTVVIREIKFQPAVLTVKVGDTVEWRNDDIVPHTATSTKPKRFDSGILPVGSSWEYVVTCGHYKGNLLLYLYFAPEYESYLNRAVSSSSPALAT